MNCPINDKLSPSKHNCRGCEYFDFDESDGGEEGRIYTPLCTYKENKESES